MPRPAGRGPTIDQVAEAAGVSRASVSRVMNGHSTVSADVTQRVKDAAEELGYRPSRLARSLSLGRTNTVALVVPDLGNPLFQRILRGAMSAASSYDYRVLVAETAENAVDEAAVALEARQRCDALILAAPRASEEALRELLPQVEPVVLINRRVPGLTVPTVRVDYASGIGGMVDHLVALGHRELVYVAGPPSSASDAERRAALVTARERFPGLRISTVPCGSSVDAGFRSADAVLATGATGVVAYNDLVALGLLARLSEIGVAVPGDISVCGFDDVELARYSGPPLTTAAVPQADLGRRAWHLLHDRMNREMAAVAPLIEPDDVVTPALALRGSTGQVPPSRRLAVSSTNRAGQALAAPASLRPVWSASQSDWVLDTGDGSALARCSTGSTLPGVHSPRPFLHPVHSLGGVPMTVTSPGDHRHHYGVSMAVADVDGTSHWGGRTFVRGQGSTLLANHGRQLVTDAVVHDGGATLQQDVRWLDENGQEQLVERRRLTAAVMPEVDAWALRWHGTLRAEHHDVLIGSPATNGRPGAGYGGLFWRLPSAPVTDAFGSDGATGDAVHGSTTPWVAVRRQVGEGWSTLLLVQTGEKPDPWFARVGDYVGLGPALAWQDVRHVAAGTALDIGVVAVVVDRRLDVADAADVVELALARLDATGARRG
jgi:LacI family transcriptional regulator